SARPGKAGAAQALGALEARTQTKGLGREARRLVVATRRVMGDGNGAQEQGHLRIERAQPDRFVAVLDRLAIATGEGGSPAETGGGCGGIWIEGHRLAKRRDRFLGAPFHHRPVAERDVPPGIAVVERDGAYRVVTASQQTLMGADPSHVGREYQAE